MDLCWVSTFDWPKESLLVRDCRLGDSYQVSAASDWSRGHRLTL